MNILEVRKLNKSYGTGAGAQAVLQDIDLDIKQGEFVSVMGPSGCGKSTLLYNISGMDKITSGSIKFNGEELSGLTESSASKLRLRKMGFIFQQSNLLKNLNLFDNIVLSAYLAKAESRRKINNRAEELMARVGISSVKDHDITQVSGGQLQRAAICRALINNPDIVFGDEPTGALNSRAAKEVMEILTGVNDAGATILLVTHDPVVAAKTERVLYMADGVIAGEKYLGKYHKEHEDLKTRESQLSGWLLGMGF